MRGLLIMGVALLIALGATRRLGGIEKARNDGMVVNVSEKIFERRQRQREKATNRLEALVREDDPQIPCSTHVDCKHLAPKTCQNGFCDDPPTDCSSNANCTSPQTCLLEPHENGVCADPPSNCSTDGDCTSPRTCHKGVCGGCNCKDFVNPNGFGNCNKMYNNKPICYVNQPTTCSDLVKSSTNPGERVSWEACKGDPCAENNGGCQQQCANNDGFATCRCTAGTLNSDGKNCDKVDPCLTNNGGCEQDCTNNNWAAECSCITGTLNNDGKNCDPARCKFSGGDVRGDREERLDNTDSEDKCADLVAKERPSATGATWHESSKKCWAEFGNNIKVSTSYRACLFPTSACPVGCLSFCGDGPACTGDEKCIDKKCVECDSRRPCPAGESCYFGNCVDSYEVAQGSCRNQDDQFYDIFTAPSSTLAECKSKCNDMSRCNAVSYNEESRVCYGTSGKAYTTSESSWKCYSKKTCEDGIKNQDETDTDCGGVCPACDPDVCPSGYERRDGDIPGWGSDIGSQLSLTRSECANACTDEKQCLSFEHSKTASLCNLNKIAEPTNKESYADYAFCTKTETCEDGIKNQDETDTDCGGVCPACGSTTTKKYTYEHLGIGYCGDYAYLPEGSYPDRLTRDHTSYDNDPIRECLNRCVAASVSKNNSNDIGNEAFYLDYYEKCACSKGACSTRSGGSDYNAYKIFQDETTYNHFVRSCVSGHNIIKYADKSIEECKSFCSARLDCLAFEYGVNYNDSAIYKPEDCVLQDSVDKSDCDGSYHNLDLYVKSECDPPCADGQFCKYGICMEGECWANSDCEKGKICRTGSCGDSCAEDYCWCVSAGVWGSCDGDLCDPDECYDKEYCHGNGYWCAVADNYDVAQGACRNQDGEYNDIFTKSNVTLAECISKCNTMSGCNAVSYHEENDDCYGTSEKTTATSESYWKCYSKKGNPCKCKDKWDASYYEASCANQRGCTDCDGKGYTWCHPIDEECDTVERDEYGDSDGWFRCEVNYEVAQGGCRNEDGQYKDFFETNVSTIAECKSRCNSVSRCNAVSYNEGTDVCYGTSEKTTTTTENSWKCYYRIDPCLTNNGGCEQNCTNNNGFADCSCTTGTINYDGKNCDLVCADQTNGATDSWKTGCDYYTANKHDCGVFDDWDFDANLMCCACKEK